MQRILHDWIIKFIDLGLFANASSVDSYEILLQDAHLSQRGRAMPRVVE